VKGFKDDVKKAKLLITLEKSKDFDAAMAKFNEIKVKNEELSKKYDGEKRA